MPTTDELHTRLLIIEQRLMAMDTERMRITQANIAQVEKSAPNIPTDPILTKIPLEPPK